VKKHSPKTGRAYRPTRSKAEMSRVAARRARLWRWCARLCLMTCVGVLGVATYLMGEKLLHNVMQRPVQQVAVEGPFEYVSRERIMAIVSAEINDQLVRLDIGRLKQALEQESWIERATVARRWPDGLHVKVEEQVPIARWAEAGFLNQRGQVIAVDGHEDLAGLPWLFGREKDSEKIMYQFQAIGELLRSRNLALDKLHIDSMGTWRLTLRSGVVLVLGDSDIQEKMQEFFYVYDHYLVNIFSAVVSIDMRYANGLAIAWADGYDVVIEGAG